MVTSNRAVGLWGFILNFTPHFCTYIIMASRIIQKSQTPIRQVIRKYATESKQATEHFPEESKTNK